MTVYATDITARKKTEEKLRIAREQLNKHAQGLEAEVRRRTAELRESIAELESFSYTVSHDLRSPLRAMQGFAHMTLDEYGEQLGEGGRDYLRRIDSAAQRMDRLIQDVITFNQVARMEMRLEPVDTGNIVDEIIHQYPSVNKPHASFEIKSPLEQVSANPAALTQALSNLLTNAVKFVGRGEAAKVKVSTVKNDGRVSICIEDNGIGIQPEFLPKIFEPFHRAHPNAGYDGTGIGLAIAKKAVERMHGTLEVESEVGKGSKFSIQLKAP